MRKFSTIAAVCALFALLLAIPAYSQGPFPSQCGALVPLAGQMPGTEPLGALPPNSTWAFKLWGETILDQPVGVAGVFQVTTGPSRSNPAITVGKLLIDETFSVNGTTIKLDDLVAGMYEVSPNCIKVNIMLGEGRSVSPIGISAGFSDFEAYFAGPDRNTLYLVTADNRGTTMTGIATRVNPAP